MGIDRCDCCEYYFLNSKPMSNIISILALIISVVASIFAAYWAWRNNVKSRQAAACAKFRAAVLVELGSIYPIPDAWPSDIDDFLRTRFTALQIAVEEFKHFIPSKQRKKFEDDWFTYRLGKDGREIDIQCYYQYKPLIITSIIDGEQVTFDNSKTYKEKFKHNVSSLLEYAKCI